MTNYSKAPGHLGFAQILQVLFGADSGERDVFLHVSDDCGDMPDHGGGQHGRELHVDGGGAAGGVHHSQDGDSSVVDLGLLGFPLGVWRARHQRE